MNNKLDVFEILNVNHKKNQEQQNAPDFDFLNVRELLLETEEPESKLQPEPEPEPESIPAIKLQPEPESENQKKVKPAKTKNKKIKLFLKFIVLIAVCALVLTFAVGFPKVTTSSMDPMISPGDHVAVYKLTRGYDRGDIIVFRSASGEKLTARIVAVKGDVVSLNNTGGLYVNNELQNEENIHTVTTITDTAVSYPVIVDDGAYFVLGDNRTDSVDSRNSEIGLVDEKDIIGKVIFCFKKI